MQNQTFLRDFEIDQEKTDHTGDLVQMQSLELRIFRKREIKYRINGVEKRLPGPFRLGIKVTTRLILFPFYMFKSIFEFYYKIFFFKNT
jgi:hypothetical protein